MRLFLTIVNNNDTKNIANPAIDKYKRYSHMGSLKTNVVGRRQIKNQKIPKDIKRCLINSLPAPNQISINAKKEEIVCKLKNVVLRGKYGSMF